MGEGLYRGRGTFVEELLSLLKKSTSKDDDAGSAIAHFVILTLGKLDHQLGDGVLDFHFFDYGSSVVGDGDFLVRRHHKFVESLRAQGGAKGGGN